MRHRNFVWVRYGIRYRARCVFPIMGSPGRFVGISPGKTFFRITLVKMHSDMHQGASVCGVATVIVSGDAGTSAAVLVILSLHALAAKNSAEPKKYQDVVFTWKKRKIDFPDRYPAFKQSCT
jgi:hypothetical protein